MYDTSLRNGALILSVSSFQSFVAIGCFQYSQCFSSHKSIIIWNFPLPHNLLSTYQFERVWQIIFHFFPPKITNKIISKHNQVLTLVSGLYSLEYYCSSLDCWLWIDCSYLIASRILRFLEDCPRTYLGVLFFHFTNGNRKVKK
jgi:hypothetical protein